MRGSGFTGTAWDRARMACRARCERLLYGVHTVDSAGGSQAGVSYR